MSDQLSFSVRGTVLIPFDDDEGHREVDSFIMIPAGTDEEIEDLVRLVEYGVVDAEVPGVTHPAIPVPQPPPFPDPPLDPDPPTHPVPSVNDFPGLG